MKLLALLLTMLLPLSALGEQADMDSLLARLESSSWVAEGAEEPQRVAYVFTDMACPYCAVLWENMQPLVNDPDNTLQVRHIIVGL
ncbi:MAG: thiol:disulfide interchange protein DsbG, partial [Alcanivorax sp.]|nr:thiol:disulfide interchange protein DsbG [Alcanivorax sp.]